MSNDSLVPIKTRGDGHCLLYSVILSIHSQHPHTPPPSIHGLKCIIFTEAITNPELYLPYIPETSKYLFAKQLNLYLIKKCYNTALGDLVPKLIANALSISIAIRDTYDNRPHIIDIIPDYATPLYNITISRENDHYSAMQFNTYDQGAAVVVDRMAHRLQPWPMDHTTLPSNSTDHGNQTHRLQTWPVSSGDHDSRLNTSQQHPVKQSTDKTIKYSSDLLKHMRANAPPIKRDIRKRLFELNIWKPKGSTDSNTIKTNRAVNHYTLLPLTLTDKVYTTPKLLKCSLANAQSIRNKVDDLLHHAQINDIDILVVTETWLQDANPADLAIISALNSNGYSFIHSPRISSTRGGGLGILYKSNLTVNCLYTSNFTSFESCVWSVTGSKLDLVIMGLYRPPYSSKHRVPVSTFNIQFGDMYQDLLAKHPSKKLLLMGDFNLHVDFPTAEVKSFMDILDSFDSTQFITSPTHVSGHTLDLVITPNDSDLFISNIDSGYYVSDHCIISFNLKLHKPPLLRHKIKSRSFKRVNQDHLRDDISDMVHNLQKSTSTDLPIDYHTNLVRILDKHAPYKSKVVLRDRKNAWFDSEAINLKSIVRRKEKIWRRLQTEESLAQFKIARRTYRDHLSKNKENHYKSAISSASGDSRQMFSVLNGLLGRTSKNPMPPAEDDLSLANDFASFFNAKVDKIRSALADVPRYQPKGRPNLGLAAFSQVSTDEISKIIKASTPTTCATDPVPSTLVKEHLDLLAPLITTITNNSLLNGIFHDSWKMATVTPLIKKAGLDTIKSNYRPVSNLSFLSKIVEKCAVKQLNNYFTRSNLHSNHQHAYKQSFSTETAVCILLDQLLWSMEKGDISILVALDLSSAFDTVDHPVLLNVLEVDFGVHDTALGWTASYLKDRRLKVKINDDFSNPVIFNHSVPQGSCLGPILFNVYSSSITHCVDPNQDIGGYADDHCLRATFTPSDAAAESKSIKEMECTIAKIGDWMSSNVLKMNATKTEITIFGSTKLLPKVTTTSLKILGDEVPTKPKLKYLGVWLDESLTMLDHIKFKCQTAAYNIRRIASIRRFIDTSTAKMLASSLVLVHLDYSNSILAGLPKTSIHLLQRIQNWAAKVVLGRQRSDSSVEALKDLHWLPIEQRIDFKILCLIYKATNGLAPALSHLFKNKSFNRETRASQTGIKDLIIPRHKKSTFAARSISVYGPTIWNHLPLYIKSSVNFASFKSSLKTHLFRHAFIL